jgi:hypothetical protein
MLNIHLLDLQAQTQTLYYMKHDFLDAMLQKQNIRT